MHTRQYLRIRYVAALVLVALLATSTYFVSLRIIEVDPNNAFLINLSGKQRMLSQRIAAQAMRLVRDTHPEHRLQTAERMRETIQAMDLARQTLTRGNPALNVKAPKSPELQGLYFEGPAPLDDEIKAYLNLARQFAEQTSKQEQPVNDALLQELIDQGLDDLAPRLDHATSLYQRLTERQRDRLLLIQSASYAATLVLLALLAFFLFEPLVKRIDQSRQGMEQLNSKLEEMALRDDLTGCYNRRKFSEIIDHETSMAKRYGQPLSLVVFDLDHFKDINDNHGHQAGDRVLTEVAKVVNGHVRQTDFLIRFGGEEFLLVLPSTNLDDAAATAEKLRAIIENHRFPGSVPVTISLGVADYRPGDSVDDIVRRADKAMYEAKALGRNRMYKAPEPDPSA